MYKIHVDTEVGQGSVISRKTAGLGDWITMSCRDRHSHFQLEDAPTLLPAASTPMHLVNVHRVDDQRVRFSHVTASLRHMDDCSFGDLPLPRVVL